MFESYLGPYQKRLEPAKRRVDKVLMSFQRLKEYLRIEVSDSKHHVAYLIASLSCNQALSYDARLVPPEVLAGEAARMHDASYDFLDGLLGTSLDCDTRWQASLPGPLGGYWLSSTQFRDISSSFPIH